MAGLGWNNIHHDLSHGRKRPCITPQIACRICDQVFTSTQALINHIESHMIEDEAVARRQHEINLLLSQRNPFILSNPSPYQPSLPIPSSGFMNPQALHERNPFPVPTATPPSRVFMPRQICTPFTPTARTFNPQHGFQLPPNVPQMPQHMATQQPPADYNNPPFSAPKPPTTNVLPDLPRPRVVKDQQDHNRKTSDDTELLDLTLRL